MSQWHAAPRVLRGCGVLVGVFGRVLERRERMGPHLVEVRADGTHSGQVEPVDPPGPHLPIADKARVLQQRAVKTSAG